MGENPTKTCSWAPTPDMTTPNQEGARMPAQQGSIARIGALMKLRAVLREAISPVSKDASDGSEKKAVARYVG